MPRRNRRPPQHTSRPRPMAPAQLDSLRGFAREHLALHTASLDRAAADELPVTASEHPGTGIRFVSVGQAPDERAIRLSEPTVPSDPAARVAG